MQRVAFFPWSPSGSGQIGPRRDGVGALSGFSSASGEMPALSSTLRATKTGSAFPSASAIPSEGRASIREVRDRKSTRLNSSHGYISYAVFCLKKKKTKLKYIMLTHLIN